MKTVKLYGDPFPANSFGFGGKNILAKPKYFEWDKTPGKARVKVFTDAHLEDATHEQSDRKIAILIEPCAIRQGIYDTVQQMEGAFDAVLTYDKELCGKGKPYLFYPLGGSWLREWKMHEKTKGVCIIYSFKKGRPGHKLRHEVATWDGIDTS